jgi:hypothetical protein
MYAADQIRNDQEVMMKAVMSIVEKDQICIDNQGGHFENARLT